MTESYLLLDSPRAHHDRVVAELVTPLAREIRGEPELSSLFYVRLSSPAWQVRFRVVGEDGWLAGRYRPLADRYLAPLREAGVVTAVEETRYEPETERYGGPAGMALAEELYTLDTLACLDLLELGRQGRLGRTPRELALLLGERLADLLRLTGERRERYYRFGYGWTEEMGTLEPDELAGLEERYRRLEPDLTELLGGEASERPDVLWGGAEAAAVVERFLAGAREVTGRLLAAHARGEVAQHVSYLGWSYHHLLCNRLGITPFVEALLSWLMHRHHAGAPLPAPAPRA